MEAHPGTMECMRTLGGRPGLNYMIRKTMIRNLMRPHVAPMKAPHVLSERFSKSQGNCRSWIWKHQRNR